MPCWARLSECFTRRGILDSGALSTVSQRFFSGWLFNLHNVSFPQTLREGRVERWTAFSVFFLMVTVEYLCAELWWAVLSILHITGYFNSWDGIQSREVLLEVFVSLNKTNETDKLLSFHLPLHQVCFFLPSLFCCSSAGSSYLSDRHCVNQNRENHSLGILTFERRIKENWETMLLFHLFSLLGWNTNSFTRIFQTVFLSPQDTC